MPSVARPVSTSPSPADARHAVASALAPRPARRGLKHGMRRLMGAAAIGLAVAGCAGSPAGGQGFSLVGDEQAAQMGAEEHPKLVEAFGGEYKDEKLQRYVEDIGFRLMSVTEMADQPFTFTIIDSPIVNAFALPGGYVHVTRGLISLARDEAELAGVIAHEIGHVTGRHSAQRMTSGMIAQVGAGLLGAVLGSEAVSQIANMGAQVYLQSYSRDQEFEADERGTRYLQAAGYDPGAMASFLQRLNDYSAYEAALRGQDNPAEQFNLMASHPRTPERVERAVQLAGGATGVRNIDPQLNAIDGMVYGSSLSQGVLNGRSFRHPELRFAFEAPEDYVIINSDEAITGYGPDGARFVFDMGAAPKGMALTTILSRSAAEGQPPLQDVERITINGLDAATGHARVRDRSGATLEVRPVIIRADDKSVYRLQLITPVNVLPKVEDSLRRFTYSFRRLTEAEARAVKPLRIDIVTVGRNDTTASLVKRMAVNERPEDLFRLLNGLEPGQNPEPGRKVRIVTN
ncbi:M48 family metalloprotease [Tistrella bauzanensis]|uniref:M48 family metalloprotease n=1 Tax=Tistrella arctica TaxID=3133430 RepID=A0ABU9YG44_9PROT